MNRQRRSSSHPPAAQYATASDSSTSARSGRAAARDTYELIYRGPLHTPRRYDQPIEEDDPVMPGDGSSSKQ